MKKEFDGCATPNKIGLSCQCESWVAKHELPDYNFSSRSGEPETVRVRRFANLFHPERFLFVWEPEHYTQSIPVEVVAGKATKRERAAGVGTLGKAHPPPMTGHRHQARRKALETAEHAAAPSYIQKFPFLEKKRSLRFNGCALMMQANRVQKEILVEFRSRFKKRWTNDFKQQQERLCELRRLSQVVIPYKKQTPTEYRRDKFNLAKFKLCPLDDRYCFVCACYAQCRHHVIAVRNGGINAKKNIVALCHSCHAKIHPWL